MAETASEWGFLKLLLSLNTGSIGLFPYCGTFESTLAGSDQRWPRTKVVRSSTGDISLGIHPLPLNLVLICDQSGSQQRDAALRRLPVGNSARVIWTQATERNAKKT